MASEKEQEREIAELRAVATPTRRATVPELEEILYTPLPVLDHGFVRVVDYMGDDGAIVQAARVSYGRGTRKVSEDKGLIHYLMRHRHSTPFEMCEIKLHVKLPIFVARQWIRHRTANVNEYSARYSILDNESRQIRRIRRGQFGNLSADGFHVDPKHALDIAQQSVVAYTDSHSRSPSAVPPFAPSRDRLSGAVCAGNGSRSLAPYM